MRRWKFAMATLGAGLAAAACLAGQGCGGDAATTGAPGTGAGAGTGAAAAGAGAGSGAPDFTKTDAFKRFDPTKLKIEGTGKLIPIDPVEGFVLVDEIRYYTKDNLSELINGEAESYVRRGVVSLASTEMAPEGETNADLRVTVHLYDLATPVNAMARYSLHLTDAYRYVKIGTEGFLGGNTCGFYKGPYLVELSAGTEAGGMEKKLEALCRAFDAKLPPADGAERAMFAKLPAEGRKANTERYDVENLAEIDGLGAGYWARYDVGGKEAAVFARVADTPEDAKKAFAEMKTALGGALDPVAGVGDEAGAAKTKYHGEVLLFRKGAIIAGVAQLDDRAAATELAKKAASAL